MKNYDPFHDWYAVCSNLDCNSIIFVFGFFIMFDVYDDRKAATPS